MPFVFYLDMDMFCHFYISFMCVNALVVVTFCFQTRSEIILNLILLMPCVLLEGTVMLTALNCFLLMFFNHLYLILPCFIQLLDSEFNIPYFCYILTLLSVPYHFIILYILHC